MGFSFIGMGLNSDSERTGRADATTCEICCEADRNRAGTRVVGTEHRTIGTKKLR